MTQEIGDPLSARSREDRDSIIALLLGGFHEHPEAKEAPWGSFRHESRSILMGVPPSNHDSCSCWIFQRRGMPLQWIKHSM